MSLTAEHKQQRKKNKEVATTAAAAAEPVDALSPNTSKRSQPSQKGSKRAKESAPPKSRKKRATVVSESSGSEFELLEGDSEYSLSPIAQAPANDGLRAVSPSPSLQSRSIGSRSLRDSPSASHTGGAAGSEDLTLNFIDTIAGKRPYSIHCTDYFF